MGHRIKIILILVVDLFLSFDLHAGCIDGRNHCTTRSNGPVFSKYCGGRELPKSQVRNFHNDSSYDLVCSSRADHFIRRPQNYDFNKWHDLKNNNPEEAFNYRRTLPLIEWQGQIPYQTIEVWKWEDCVYGTSSYHCGTREECHNESRSDCTTDSKGKRSCTSRTERVCTTVSCSCWYDDVQTASLHCSNESMSFKAKFERPSVSEWNLKDHPYSAVLPNKYDLLPGEVEDVQVFNTGSTSSVLQPEVQVGNAWNFYTPKIKGSGVNSQCRMNNPTSIDVTLVTDKRNEDKASPNPFALPVNQFGESLEPIKNWVEANDPKSGDIIKVRPKSIQLMDTSAAVVTAIAEQSRAVAEREKLKAEMGEGANKDGARFSEFADSFFKNTTVRVRLEKVSNWWWPNQRTLNKKFSSDSESLAPSFHYLNSDQDIANSDMWEVDLSPNGEEGTDSDFYRAQYLMPDRRYNLLFSVYQKGVPFYKADCDTRNVGWRCLPVVRHTWFGVSEDEYFSKDLVIPFGTDKGYDERPYILGLPYPGVRQGLPVLKWFTNPELLFELWSSEKNSP